MKMDLTKFRLSKTAKIRSVVRRDGRSYMDEGRFVVQQSAENG